ncbi:MAG: patatin-like phospholipase family protein [Prevotella sp.]|nr:patatin-like phospholipase family protein [Prevotella sp.]
MKRKAFWLCAVLALLMCSTAKAQQTAAQRPRVGLVLGGGGAKGAAEVGALKVIEEAGIPIDYIAGTSIGSIVGGLYAVGWRAAALDSMFRSQEWLSLLGDRDKDEGDKMISHKDGVTYVFGFPVSRRGSKNADVLVGALNGDHVVELLQQMTGCPDSVSFDSLPIPFRCVATDVNRPEEVVIGSGNLPHAMRASMAIPGAFKPVRSGKRLLIDGGAMNNLPVDVVKQMGADIVIAIDLSQEEKKPRDFSLKDSFGIGGWMDWLFSRPDIEKYEHNRKSADICINPRLGSYGVTSFNKDAVCAMICLGEHAARQHWDELIALKERLKR